MIYHLGHHQSFPLGRRWRVVPYNLFFRDEDREVFRDLIAAQRRIANYPCNQYSVDSEKAATEGFVTKARFHHGFITTMLMGGPRARIMAIEADAKRRLALAAVAVCRFRAARGRLPDRLADLSPQFLAVVPRDPFDFEGRPLRMTKAEAAGALVVDSVGEDGKDDGGIPWNPQEQAGDIIFTIKHHLHDQADGKDR